MLQGYYGTWIHNGARKTNSERIVKKLYKKKLSNTRDFILIVVYVHITEVICSLKSVPSSTSYMYVLVCRKINAHTTTNHPSTQSSMGYVETTGQALQSERPVFKSGT